MSLNKYDFQIIINGNDIMNVVIMLDETDNRCYISC